MCASPCPCTYWYTDILCRKLREDMLKKVDKSREKAHKAQKFGWKWLLIYYYCLLLLTAKYWEPFQYNLLGDAIIFWLINGSLQSKDWKAVEYDRHNNYRLPTPTVRTYLYLWNVMRTANVRRLWCMNNSANEYCWDGWIL